MSEEEALPNLRQQIKEIFMERWKDPKQYIPNNYERKVFDKLDVLAEKLQKRYDELNVEIIELMKMEHMGKVRANKIGRYSEIKKFLDLLK